MYARKHAIPETDLERLPPRSHVRAATDLFRLISDPTRMSLLWLLSNDEFDVTSLAERIGAPRPAVSQHLAKLRLGGLVTSRKEGRRVLYKARNRHVRSVLEQALQQVEHQLGDLPEHD